MALRLRFIRDPVTVTAVVVTALLAATVVAFPVAVFLVAPLALVISLIALATQRDPERRRRLRVWVLVSAAATGAAVLSVVSLAQARVDSPGPQPRTHAMPSTRTLTSARPPR